LAAGSGTCWARCQKSSLNGSARPAATWPRQMDGTSSLSRTRRFCWSVWAASARTFRGLRELTVNGLDAIAALGADTGGRVVWDLDWERFDASAGRVRKLSVIDTGTGMTAGQLRYYINQLAASGREQSLTGNFGVSAKVAAGSRNPHELEYRSWHGGEGSLVCFKRHPDGRWGLDRRGGQTAAPTSGGHWGRRRSRGFCAARITALRSCCSARMSGTTPLRRRGPSSSLGGNGSRDTSTVASCVCHCGPRCWYARILAAASRGSCGGSTANATTLSTGRSRLARWS